MSSEKSALEVELKESSEKLAESEKISSLDNNLIETNEQSELVQQLEEKISTITKDYEVRLFFN